MAAHTVQSIADEVRVDIDLRLPRAAAERRGERAIHAGRTGAIGDDVTTLLSSEPMYSKARMMITPLAGGSGTKSDPQVIEIISLFLAPATLAGLATFILRLVDACRAKIPTEYEIHFPGAGKLRVSGPSMKPQDVREVLAMLTEMKRQADEQLSDANNEVIRIEAQEGIE
jgi:hypothetical protein